MSKLLLDEAPLQLLPGLACAVGLNQAVVLQQLHWLEQNPAMGKIIDGRKWIRMTLSDWRTGHFPFWSEATIQRAFEDLEKQGLANSRHDLNSHGYDRTNWYSINHEGVNAAEEKANKDKRVVEHSNMINGHSKMRPGESQDATPEESKLGNAESQSGATIPDTSSDASSDPSTEIHGAGAKSQNAPDLLPPDVWPAIQDASDIWNQVKFELSHKLNKQQYKQCIQGTRGIAFDGSVLIVHPYSALNQEILQNGMGKIIQGIADGIFHRPIQIHYEVQNETN